MGREGIDSGCQEDAHRNVPRWCVEEMSLLSRAEVETITHREDNDADDVQGRGTPDETTQTRHLSAHHRFVARAAELPMLLQTEALVLRRHEQQFRQYMKELVEVSESVVLMCDGTLRQQSSSTASRAAEEALSARQAEDDALLRILRRAEELERCVRVAAVDRVRTAQRMVLAATVAKHRDSANRRASGRRVKMRR